MANTTTTKMTTSSGYTDENIKALQAKLDKASEQLKTYNTNTAADEVLKKRAESEYTPIYNAQVGEQESAKQTAQTALNERLSALNRQYGRDSEALGKAYEAQKVAANNQMLARGMNNSSLALAMLNRVDEQRNKALADLQAERTANETSAQNEYTDAVKAADAAIARLKTDMATNVDARYQELRDAEQQRVMQATQAQNDLTKYTNELMMQIEQLRQQGYSQYLQQQQAEAEREAAQREYEIRQQQYADSKAQQEWENQFNQQQYADSKAQQERDEAFKQQQYADSKAQQERDEAFRQQQYADSKAQQEWENQFNQQQAAAEQDRWQKDFDFEQQQYSDSQKKSSGSNSGSAKKSSTSGATKVQTAANGGSDLEQMYNSQSNGPISSILSAISSGIKKTASAAVNAGNAVKKTAEKATGTKAAQTAKKANGTKAAQTAKK